MIRLSKGGKKNKEGKDDEKHLCPTHVEAKQVFFKKMKVWAGAASKTKSIPKGALIVDLADKYGNGVYGYGIEVPKALIVPRLVIEWPDMSKAHLFKSEWQAMAAWFLTDEKLQNSGIYVACLEGHGRTGTFLSILGRMIGEIPETIDPVKYVRTIYCPDAVETATQITYIEDMLGIKCSQKPSKGFTTTTYSSNWEQSKCRKTVKSVTENCMHDCSQSASGNHVEHWCNKCKLDWWLDKDGNLHEKGAPGNKMYSPKDEFVHPGPHEIVEKPDLSKPVVTSTTTTYPTTHKHMCVSTKDVADEGCGENKDGTKRLWHWCGREPMHTAAHECRMCKYLWPKFNAPITPTVPKVDDVKESTYVWDGSPVSDYPSGYGYDAIPPSSKVAEEICFFNRKDGTHTHVCGETADHNSEHACLNCGEEFAE